MGRQVGRLFPTLFQEGLFCKSAILLRCRCQPLPVPFGKIDTGRFDGVDDGKEGLEREEVGGLKARGWEYILFMRKEGRGEKVEKN